MYSEEYRIQIQTANTHDTKCCQNANKKCDIFHIFLSLLVLKVRGALPLGMVRGVQAGFPRLDPVANFLFSHPKIPKGRIQD